MYKMMCALYIGLWVGRAAAMVGKIPENTMEPYGEALPFIVLAAFMIPAILGYLAGSDT